MACPRKALHRAALGVGLFAATPRYRCGVSASIPKAFTLTSLSTMPMISARGTACPESVRESNLLLILLFYSIHMLSSRR